MKVFTTRSIRQLTILGFVVVAALLLAALLVTARQLDGLSEQSQRTVASATRAMSAGRQLIEQSMAMERNARQFAVLGDATLLQLYRDRRNDFLQLLTQLTSFDLGPDVMTQGAQLLDSERSVYERLQQIPAGGSSTVSIPELSSLAYRIADAIEQWIVQQQDELRASSETTKQALTVQALLLVATAAALVVLFVWLITHPLRQIDRAINGIGSGEYDRPVRVTGPEDLRQLGTRLEWLRNRLRELEQQRSSFLRHVSHELKTPLASMQEGAALLNEGVVGPLTPQQQEISVIIGNNCQRLQGLIEDLLRHNAQAFAVLNVMPEPVRLDALIEGVVDAHRLAINNDNLQVEMSLEKVTVLGDPEKLRVIIDNLFTNAVKYSPTGASIRIVLQAGNSEVECSISDEGPGVPSEQREKIFEAFFQGAAPENKAYTGSGLGLAIVREYVEASQGRVALVDTAAGACFRVVLPIASTAA
ncbi:MAG: HAMP domain-containing histidine kinase [Pseudomonadales bacterium]|nr:HAMP domain-containing histidine kinase [Pseudomonadales bacterium]